MRWGQSVTDIVQIVIVTVDCIRVLAKSNGKKHAMVTKEKPVPKSTNLLLSKSDHFLSNISLGTGVDGGIGGGACCGDAVDGGGSCGVVMLFYCCWWLEKIV